MTETTSGTEDAKVLTEATSGTEDAKAASTDGTSDARSDAPLLKDGAAEPAAGEVKVSVETDADEADGRPEGYNPTRPGHFYLAFWLLSFGVVNDVLQASTLIVADMQGSAASCLTCTAITLVLIAGIHVQDKTHPWKEVQASAKRGEPTELWEGTVSLEQSVQRLGVGFAAAYGMMCCGTLSGWSALSALLGLALSAHSSTDLLVLLECSRPSAVKALRPRTFLALTAWCACRMAAELTFFAIAGAVLHPLIIFGAILLCFLVQRLTAHELGYDEPAGLVSLLPVNWSRGKASILCIVQGKAKAPMPAWPVVITIWLRFVLLTYLSQMDLPQGVHFSQFGLDQPMGKAKYKKFVTIPLRGVLTAAKTCIGGNAVAWWPLGYDTDGSWSWWPYRLAWRGFSFVSCSIDGIGQMSLGTVYFRFAVSFVAYVAVPAYLIGSVVLLVVNAKYRRGEVDDDLQQELKGKYVEIKKWSDARIKKADAADTKEAAEPATDGDATDGATTEAPPSPRCARVMSLACCHRPQTGPTATFQAVDSRSDPAGDAPDEDAVKTA